MISLVGTLATESIVRLDSLDDNLIEAAVTFENDNLPSVFHSSKEIETELLTDIESHFHYCALSPDGSLEGSVAFHIVPMAVLDELLCGRLTEAEVASLPIVDPRNAAYFSVFVARTPILAARLLAKACCDISAYWEGKLRVVGAIAATQAGERFAERSGMLKLNTCYMGFPCYKVIRTNGNARYICRLLT